MPIGRKVSVEIGPTRAHWAEIGFFDIEGSVLDSAKWRKEGNACG
jgi:hypothetical protein